MKVFRFFKLVVYSVYEWTLRWANTRYALLSLAIVAFAESSFFPIPPDVLLIPMVISAPLLWRRYFLVATGASVIGGMFGYLIGFSFYEAIGKNIVELYNLEATMKIIGTKYSEGAFLTIFTAAFTPIPYKIITISAGLFKINFTDLVIASLLGRGARFFLVAVLLRIFGERVKNFIEKYFNILSLIFAGLLIGGFVAIKFLF